jgi:hypothetical protein
LAVGPDELVGHLLLLGRQAGVERLERNKKTGVIPGAHLRELLAELEALDRIHIGAVLAGGGNGLVELLGIFPHCRLDLLPLRFLCRRYFQLGLQEGDAPIDKFARHPALCRVMAGIARRCSGIRRLRRGLR